MGNGSLRAIWSPRSKAVPRAAAICHVAGVLQPTADSEIHFEVWLPEKDWNSRFLGVGNGGFAGSIGYRELAGNVRRLRHRGLRCRS